MVSLLRRGVLTKAELEPKRITTLVFSYKNYRIESKLFQSEYSEFFSSFKYKLENNQFKEKIIVLGNR
ncbi:MAG: hypothetical protein ACTSVB_03055 [Candidatus Heimdallarchaeaceae archaeon]